LPAVRQLEVKERYCSPAWPARKISVRRLSIGAGLQILDNRKTYLVNSGTAPT
jgi:hypothetical protein